ncbi:MAG TPA: hypothetical protein VHO25_10800 [Polyangiaceae bacterium]|nr:hypothetical protein [Polyangiaceae bacterium]
MLLGREPQKWESNPMQPPNEPPAGSALEQLLALEAAHGLWHRELLGYPFWPSQRLGYSLKLSNLHVRSQEKLRSERSKARLKRIARSGLDTASKLRTASRRDIWVLSSTVYRRRIGEADTCIFAQHLQEQLGDRLLFLENNPNLAPVSPAPDRLFIDSLLLTARELAGKSTPLCRAVVRKQLAELSDAGISADSALKEAIAGQIQYQIWIRLLRRYRPRAVFVLCGYSQHIPCQLAARRLNIPLIELQHGIIHSGHAGYAFGDEVRIPHAPNHIVVFGRRFGKLLDHSAYWQGKWSIGGHPWLRRIRALHATTSLGKPLIAIFSQNTAVVQHRLRAFALELRRLMPQPVEIVLKPHPGEVDAERVYEELVANGVTVADRMSDSYALLARTTVSICEFSTLALEALAFPCHSLVLHSSALSGDLHDLAQAGVLNLVNSAHDVAPFLGLGAVTEQREQIVDSYFAFHSAEPDFAALIARCESTTSSSPDRL